MDDFKNKEIIFIYKKMKNKSRFWALNTLKVYFLDYLLFF